MSVTSVDLRSQVLEVVEQFGHLTNYTPPGQENYEGEKILRVEETTHGMIEIHFVPKLNYLSVIEDECYWLGRWEGLEPDPRYLSPRLVRKLTDLLKEIRDKLS